MEEEKGKDEAEDWKIYEALCSKTPTEVSLLCKQFLPCAVTSLHLQTTYEAHTFNSKVIFKIHSRSDENISILD